MGLHVAVVVCLLAVCSMLACGRVCGDETGPVVVELKNTSPQPDFNRLPRFCTSDAAYDEFVNDYFMRHLSVDERGIYLGGGPVLGITDHMWVIEWDWWMLPWIDRGAMGLARQGNSREDVILTTLRNCSVDKYGYAWGARLYPESHNVIGGHIPTFSWPWPKYNRNTGTSRPTGWEFNDLADGAREEWIGRGMELESGYVDHCLAGAIRGQRPEILSPKFDCDVFQIPIIELDIAYQAASGEGADRLVDGLRVYWTTDTQKRFSEERCVSVDFADLPPRDFPADYARYVSGRQARYPLYFPMYLHPQWGREGRRITRLKIVPAGSGSEGATVTLNYVRASYDVRLSTTNATLINASAKFCLWSGDTEFLTVMMPRLRRAMLFMNEHLGGRKDGLLNFGWMVGKDGLGGDEPGHGLIGSYWDLLPAGRYDIESSLSYYYALNSMAELERVVRHRGTKLPEVTVLGPDNETILRYTDTAESLSALARRVKSRIEDALWNRETGRFVRNVDANGKQHDYGFLHFNVLALAFGVGTEAQRQSILSWLDGRVIAGDTSTGNDIYKWRFAPRTTTRQNTSYYFWPWNWDREHYPGSSINYVFGEQMQNGGAVPFTSLFELVARCGSGDQKQIDRAFERTQEIRRWFEDVKAAGGKGQGFYRAYYDNHPERGRQQSPNPGGLGLDHEFLSDGSLGTEFIFHAFLGIDTEEDGVISVAPAVPSQVDRIGVTNVFFRGNHLTIEAGRGYVSFEGSRVPRGEHLRARVTLRGAARGSRFFVDGKPAPGARRGPHDTITMVTDLRPVRIELR